MYGDAIKMYMYQSGKIKETCSVLQLKITRKSYLQQIDMISKKNKPIKIKDYNNFMSGIDHSDQMVSYYSCPRKTAKWYKKVLFHLLDISAQNSYFIFNKKFDVTNATFKQFHNLFIKNLIGLPIDTTTAELFKNKKSST